MQVQLIDHKRGEEDEHIHYMRNGNTVSTRCDGWKGRLRSHASGGFVSALLCLRNKTSGYECTATVGSIREGSVTIGDGGAEGDIDAELR